MRLGDPRRNGITVSLSFVIFPILVMRLYCCKLVFFVRDMHMYVVSPTIILFCLRNCVAVCF